MASPCMGVPVVQVHTQRVWEVRTQISLWQLHDRSAHKKQDESSDVFMTFTDRTWHEPRVCLMFSIEAAASPHLVFVDLIVCHVGGLLITHKSSLVPRLSSICTLWRRVLLLQRVWLKSYKWFVHTSFTRARTRSCDFVCLSCVLSYRVKVAFTCSPRNGAKTERIQRYSIKVSLEFLEWLRKYSDSWKTSPIPCSLSVASKRYRAKNGFGMRKRLTTKH